MTATDLSPLAAWREPFAALRDCDLRLRELAFLTQLALRIDATTPAALSLQAELGLRLPDRFGIYTRVETLDALWLGPDEWLLVAPPGNAARLLGAMTHGIDRVDPGTHHLAIDVSANRTCIELAGDDARYVLAKGCHEDVAAEVLRGPRVVQTVLAKVPVILQLSEATPVLRVFVRASMSAHLARWLLDAAAEIVAARRYGHDNLRGRFGRASI